VEKLMRRHVELRVEHFPHNTASGFWIRLAERDIIIVEASTPPDHRLVVFGHELWHMYARRGRTPSSPQIDHAARHIADHGPELGQAFLAAARSACDDSEEEDAELFGLHLASLLQRLIQEDSTPRDGLSRRIHQSLGY
jgi:hypothetical protein